MFTLTVALAYRIVSVEPDGFIFLVSLVMDFVLIAGIAASLLT